MTNPRSFVLKLDSPLSGVVRRTSYQSQPPFSAYSSLNMLPWDARTGRALSAVRPPRQVITTPSGVCTAICRVNGVESNKPIQGLVAAFGGNVYYLNNANGWTAATGSHAGSIATTRAVFSTPFLQNAIIFDGSQSPLVFEYGAATVAELVESAGTAPQGAKFGHVFQGALFVGGEAGNEHILYQSGVGGFTDWGYGVSSDDEGGAWFSGVDDSGLLNGPITAILSANSDRILISTLEGLVQLAALPRQGGVFDKVSSQYVLGQGAWCKLPDDTLCMMTPAGFMTLAPKPGAVPALISRNLIPDELIGLAYNYDNPVVSMAYDTRWNAVVITVRGVQEQSWLWDPTLGGFHPLQFLGYPYQLLEYPPFITEQTSGLLFAGADLSRWDVFGNENIESGITIGPVQIADSSMRKSMIQRMRVVFGRDTPNIDGDGTLTVVTGNDGQDCINRLLTGDLSNSYEVALSTLAKNNGLCYPKLAGCAAAISIRVDSGDLALEEFTLEMTESGFNSRVRGEQIAIEGEPFDLTTTTNTFDANLWGGHVTITPDDPCSTLVDTTLFLDMSLLPAEFWNHVNLSGSDIRVTDINNVPCPFDLIRFDRAAKTGFLAMKATQTIPAIPLRVWAGRFSAGPLATNDQFGQYNAYDAATVGFWPAGGGEDRTINANHFAMTGATAGGATGPIGSLATDYGGNTNWYGVADNANVPAAYPLTLMIAGNRAAATTTNRGAFGVHKSDATPTTNAFLTLARNTGGTNGVQSQITTTNTTPQDAITAEGGSPYQWHHYAGTVAGAASRSAFLNGAGKVTDTDSLTLELMDQIVIGKGSRAGLSSNSFQGVLALASLANVVRSDCWILYQAQMLDQNNFWNVEPWQQVNEEEDAPEVPDNTNEVGTWSGYAEATPITPAANLIDWIHYLDLSELPGDWWSAVDATGKDIRATDADNRFIPLDVIEFDKGSMTGFATVRLSQTATEARSIRLWVGNPDAIVLPTTANYGQFGVYPGYVKGFWPSGGGQDRTSGQRHLTMIGAVAGNAAGPIGNRATTYNGSNQYGTVFTTAIPQAPLTLSAVTKTNTLAAKQTAISINRTKYLGHSTLVHSASDQPHTLEVRAYDTTAYATSGVAGATGGWKHEVGFVAQNTIRGIVVNGTGPDDASKKSIKTHDYNRITVGARLSGQSTIYWPWNGELSLLAAYGVVFDLNGNWADYQNAMLDQSTFWGGGWAWTTESNALPQT